MIRRIRERRLSLRRTVNEKIEAKAIELSEIEQNQEFTCYICMEEEIVGQEEEGLMDN